MDPLDIPMQDAAALCATDHQGNALWHPASLADLMAVGARAWDLWEQIQAGLAARAHPTEWWRVRGIPTAHLFMATATGSHEESRCGWTAPADAEWIRTDDPPRCRGCEGMTTAPAAGWGSVGETEESQ